MSSVFTPLLNSLALASSSPDQYDERPAKRSKKSIDDEPMYAHIVMHSCAGEGGKQGRNSAEQLRNAVLKAMFNAAANPKSTEPNRRKIYKVWREEGGDDDDEDDE